MIDSKLKTIINDLMYAKNEKDLKIKMLRNLKDLLITNNLTIQDYEKISEAFQTIAKSIEED